MKPKESNPTQTVLTITVGFLVIYAFTKIPGFFYTSLIVGILGLLSNYLARKIDYLWMKLTWLLSLIMPNVILSVVFFIFLVPIAFLSRLFQKEDQLHLKNNSTTLFKTVNRTYEPASFEKPW